MTFKKVAAFADIGKSAKDLLVGGKTEGIYTPNSTFAITTKTPDGVTFNVTAVKKPDSDVLDSALKITQTFNNGKFGTILSLGSDGKVIPSLTIKDILPNFNATLTGAIPDTQKSTLALDYALPYVTAKAIVGLNSTPKVDVTASTGYERTVVGGSVVFDSARNDISSWVAGLGYTAPDYQLGLFLNDSGKSVRGTLVHNYSATQVVGAEVTRSLKDDQSTVFTVGYQQRLADGGLLKGRIDNLGIATLLYETELKPTVTTTVQGTVDVLRMEKAPKFGVAVGVVN